MTFSTLVKRYVLGLAAILLIGTNLSCSSPRESASPDAPKRTSLQGDETQPLTLQELVQLAALDSDPEVRRDSARALSLRGDAGSVACLFPLVTDKNPGVRFEAIGAIMVLVGQLDLDPRQVTEAFIPALESETAHMNRQSLLYGLAHLSSLPEDAEQVLRELMQDADPKIRVMAGTAIASHVPDGGDIVAATIRITPPHRHTDRWLAEKLYLCEAQHLPEVRMLTSSPSAAARFLANTAIGRLEGQPGNWQGASIEREGRKVNQAANKKLVSALWSKVDLSVIHQAAGNSRVVLFGEMHSDHGPIREAQKSLLRSFVRDAKFDALGYEPSVQGAQEEVLALARELGLQTISTEPNWEVLCAQSRHVARDNETAQVINDYLALDPRNRMFVIRGEFHTTPGGHLAQQLVETPMIVLSLENLPLRFSEGTVQPTKELHKIHLGPHTYSWPCFPQTFKHLQTWLDKRQEQPQISHQ